MKTGLIGCGRIGTQRHIQAFAESNSRLFGVCDAVLHKARDAARKYLELSGKTVRIFNDYKEMLRNVDWVSIATESGYHFPIARYVISQGKHLLIEKPMTLTTDEADILIEEAKENNCTIGVCYQNRFNFAIKELLKKVDEGSFGKIFHITARILWCRDETYYKQASWRGTKKLDGGMLHNQCSHSIDILQRIANSPIKEIWALKENLNHPYIETEDEIIATIKFQNGTIGLIEATTNTYPSNAENSISVFGKTGSAVIGGVAMNEPIVWQFQDETNSIENFRKQIKPQLDVYGYGHKELFKNFETAIANNSKPEITAEEGRKSIEIIQQILSYKLRS